MDENDQVEAVRRVSACPTDYYAVLDVPHTATSAQIKTSFKRWSLLVHPDKNRQPGASKAFQALLKARNVLMDIDKRKDFDQELRRVIGGNNRDNRSSNSQRNARPNGGRYVKNQRTSPFNYPCEFLSLDPDPFCVLMILLILHVLWSLLMYYEIGQGTSSADVLQQFANISEGNTPCYIEE